MRSTHNRRVDLWRNARVYCILYRSTESSRSLSHLLMSFLFTPRNNAGLLRLIANTGFLTVLECTKFVFGSAPGQARELTALPQTVRPLTGLRGPFLTGGRGRKEREAREGKTWKGRKWGTSPNLSRIAASLTAG